MRLMSPPAGIDQKTAAPRYIAAGSGMWQDCEVKDPDAMLADLKKKMRP
jgi:hypothetical protein